MGQNDLFFDVKIWLYPWQEKQFIVNLFQQIVFSNPVYLWHGVPAD